MALKKRFLILITCFSIVFAHSLYSNPPETGNSNDAKGKLEKYIEGLKELAKTNKEEEFDDIIRKLQGMEEVVVNRSASLWKGTSENPPDGYGVVTGEYIGKIIINNLDKPQKLRHIGNYILILSKKLLDKNFVTASRKLFNRIVKELKDSNRGIERMKLCGLTDSDLNQIKINRKAHVLSGFEKLGGSLQRFPNQKTQNEGGDNAPQGGKTEIQKSLRKLQEELSEIKNNYLNRKENIFTINLELFISILCALVFFSILLGLLALFLKSKTKVKLSHMTILKQRVNILWGKNTDDEKKEETQGRDLNEIPNKKPNGDKAVDIEKGLELLVEEMINLADLVGKRLPQKPEGDLSQYDERIKKVENDFKYLDETYRTEIESRIATVEKGLKEKETAVDLVMQTKNVLNNLSDILPHFKPLKPGEKQNMLSENQILEKMVDIEQDNLKKIFKRILPREEKSEMYRLKAEIEEKNDFFRLCDELEKQMNFNNKLSSYYGKMLKPLQNYKYKIGEILDTTRLIPTKDGKEDDKKDALKPRGPGKDINEIRQKISFLSFLEHVNEIPDLLNFKLEDWIQKEFLGFADQFLRVYQKDEYSNVLSPEMEDARTTVFNILSFFDIEPIPIVLGQTDFDSQIHSGQDKISERSMIDGAIAEVIKNGFKKKDGEVIIRPEVVVNRV